MARGAALTFIVLALTCTAARLCTASRKLTTSSTVASKYSLIFFGDSLTETGNVFRISGAPNPKLYYKGRFTNGPNWVDYMKEELTQRRKLEIQTFNYAYAGATACRSPLIESLYPFVKNLTSQVADFAADVAAGKARLSGSRTIIMQYIGSNDILFAFYTYAAALASNSTLLEGWLEQLVRDVVTCRTQAAAAAAAVPGVTDIAILPISPLHTSPDLPEDYGPLLVHLQDAIAEQVLAAMAALNSTLAAAPAGTPGAGVRVYVIGDYQWIESGVGMVTPPFTHLRDPCFWQPISAMVITPGLTTCTDPDKYFFYDQSHPTTRFHHWFALKGLLPRMRRLKLLP